MMSMRKPSERELEESLDLVQRALIASAVRGWQANERGDHEACQSELVCMNGLLGQVDGLQAAGASQELIALTKERAWAEHERDHAAVPQEAKWFLEAARIGLDAVLEARRESGESSGPAGEVCRGGDAGGRTSEDGGRDPLHMANESLRKNAYDVARSLLVYEADAWRAAVARNRKNVRIARRKIADLRKHQQRMASGDGGSFWRKMREQEEIKAQQDFDRDYPGVREQAAVYHETMRRKRANGMWAGLWRRVRGG